jgi:O-antigen ligase
MGYLIRSTGGFSNPNSLGFVAMAAAFLCFAVTRMHEARPIEKGLAAAFLAASLLILMKSVARSSILATCAGLITMMALDPMSKKMRMMAICALAGVCVLFVLPSDLWNSVQERFDPDYIKGTEFGMRVPIAIDYFNQWPTYIVQGVGYNRAVEVTRNSFTTRELWEPHNTYLTVLVEYGFIGFLLFMASMASLWRRIVARKREKPLFSANSTYAGLLVAIASFFIVGTYGTRDFWLCWAVLAVWGNWTQLESQKETTGNSCAEAAIEGTYAQ